MKKYYYNKNILWVSIILPVILMLGLFIWSVYEIVNEGPRLYNQLLLITIPLLLISMIIGLSNPFSITVSKDYIIFEGFGIKHNYYWTEVESISVKDYGYIGKSFIKIGKYRFFGGRYWVSSHMHGYTELVSVLQSKMDSQRVKKSKTHLIQN